MPDQPTDEPAVSDDQGAHVEGTDVDVEVTDAADADDLDDEDLLASMDGGDPDGEDPDGWDPDGEDPEGWDPDAEDAYGQDADGRDPDGEDPGDLDDELGHDAPTSVTPTVLQRLRAAGPAAPLLAAVLPIGLLIWGFVVLGDRSTVDRVEIGQCVSLREDNRIDPVDCDDDAARFRVVFIEEDTTEPAAASVCARFPESTMSYFEGDHDSPDGDLVCLGNPP